MASPIPHQNALFENKWMNAKCLCKNSSRHCHSFNSILMSIIRIRRRGKRTRDERRVEHGYFTKISYSTFLAAFLATLSNYLHKCKFDIEKFLFFAFSSLIWNSAIFTADWLALHCSKWEDISQPRAFGILSNCCFLSCSPISISICLSWFKERRKWRNNGNGWKKKKKGGKTNGKCYMWDSLSISSHNKCQLIYRETTNNKYTIKVSS